MKRRSLLSLGTRFTLGALGYSAASRAIAQPSYRVSAEQLQRMIAERFPVRYPVASLFDLEVDTPRLRMLPELNRLASDFTVQAAGPALRRSYTGSFEVDFRLRYEASDQSIRAHDLRARSFQLPGLTPQALALLDAYGQALAQQALLEVVLHRLRARDLALADAMGLQPGDITVTPDALVIAFVAKQVRREN
jgi:hypothetical protein